MCLFPVNCQEAFLRQSMRILGQRRQRQGQQSVLDGSKVINLSHGGGKPHDLIRDLFKDVKNICICEGNARNGVQGVLLYMLGIFCAEKHTLHVRTDSDSLVSSALVCQGIFLCTPLWPHTAVMMDALELYCMAQNHCPHFSIQAFVKTILDLQGVQYCPYLAHLFSIALDIYLQVCLAVNDLVLKALYCDTLDWCLKNACPTCMYTLKDEPNLKFKLLFAMDGNDLLKCISRAAISSYESTVKDIGEQFLGDNCYLSRAFIDQFGVGCSNESLKEPTEVEKHERRCYIKDVDVFDEAGIFVAICRHGFSLVVADIVWSGEQAKYPLATVSKLLDVFGDGLMGSYDIGSRYIDGMGLETLKVTNRLASAVHYASAFHWCQAIVGYIAHNNEHKVYQNLTTMIFHNYRQALCIIQEGKNTLPHLMDDLGIMDVRIFKMWLLEENKYLAACSHEPEEETLHMEYWQKLINLDTSWKLLSDLAWTVATLSSTGTLSFNFEKDLKMVQDLEVKLGITKHWLPEDEEWQTAGHLVANHKYQHCLNQLESLIITQIF
ncbi:hypothetical protein EDD16DRAFT_1522538 [Pisolithus croceorrhizus]|nr:hypothetical protein EV401DRAFT_1895536 [Pisolithus croceorrhizus]KAI6109306.1 hypothetical protein EDD16DRAFT_1522538 [Pisolithus croceorrhizus]KAI6167768.1 hypothetical protein EDD17DRAFT_1503985 [Pisolithus thermaeus]